MKKIIILVSIIILVTIIKQEEYYVIPKNAIRLRIIANSDTIKDQNIKNKIKENINNEINKILEKTTIEESRKEINNNIENIKKVIEKVLQEENTKYEYKIDFGINYFPEKIYKNVKYEAGNYESLVVTLGEGKGNNWWCVLFPPICVLEENEKTKIEYKSYVKEIVEKYAKNN